MSPAEREKLEERECGRPYDRLKAYVVSDVHLNNHPYDQAREPENPRRRNFRFFLTQINETLQPTDKVQLILNGDILDINGSWTDDRMPWDTDQAAVEAVLLRLLVEIMENNLAALNEIRKLLQHPHAEVVYIFGNHDGLLQRFPASHEVIREFLCPLAEYRERVHFRENFESEELDMYVAHGHLLDPFNHSKTHEPPLGEVVNLLIVNRFVEQALDKMRAHGYTEAFVRRMHARLHDIEYLRPLSLLPVWVQTTANHFQSHPENAGKSLSVKDILLETASEIIRDPQMLGYMTRHLHLPRSFLNVAIAAMMRVPVILPFISFIGSNIIRRGHSNKYQYKAAQKLRHEKGYRIVAFGHTHIPSVLPLSEDAYYFNTGSWKPVINLFKHSKDPVELEALNPDVQFNKVERCGILRIEKTDFSGRVPAEFALQTIQSGVS